MGLSPLWSRLTNIHLPSMLNRLHRLATMPMAILLLTWSAKIHPDYALSRWRRFLLGLHFFWNNARMESASSYRAHLVLAMKLLQIPKSTDGCVVECGCFKGAVTVNLSIVCKLAGRTLKVYDSFEGLPPPRQGDLWPENVPFVPGLYRGTLDEVRDNVRRKGCLEVCEFHKGWFADTLPRHEGDVVMAVVDVDYHSSLYECVTKLWPHLVNRGYFFIDEYVLPDYCALFYSEKFWQKHFRCDPPGLIGAGSGVQVGEYYLGPWDELPAGHDPASIAYTQKGMNGKWSYSPDEQVTDRANPGRES